VAASYQSLPDRKKLFYEVGEVQTERSHNPVEDSVREL